MLFDLRGRHRRRAVRIIYTGLAVLMGVGLVGFGIGGGLRRRWRSAERRKQQRRLERARASPSRSRSTKSSPRSSRKNASAWENLANAELHEAGGEKYVTRPGVTRRAKNCCQGRPVLEQLRRAEPAQTQLRTGPAHGAVFGEEGLNEPARRWSVLQIVWPRGRPAPRCTRRSRRTPTKRTTRAWGTSRPQRRSASRPRRNGRG